MFLRIPLSPFCIWSKLWLEQKAQLLWTVCILVHSTVDFTLILCSFWVLLNSRACHAPGFHAYGTSPRLTMCKRQHGSVDRSYCLCLLSSFIALPVPQYPFGLTKYRLKVKKKKKTSKQFQNDYSEAWNKMWDPFGNKPWRSACEASPDGRVFPDRNKLHSDSHFCLWKLSIYENIKWN